MNDKENPMDKGYMTLSELIADIQKDDPTYLPPSKTNVVPLKPTATEENIIPIAWSDFKKDVPKPIEYIFYPCLPVQGIAFIYAATGLGKTLFTLNLAWAIAGGGNFLKYTCPKPRKVLYVDAEMAHNQIYGRLKAIEERQGVLDFEENLHILTPDKILPYRLPRLDVIEDQMLYQKIIEKGNFEVIIFDSLALLSSFDENKSHEWVIIQDWLLYLRSLGKTIIIIHHAGKNTAGYRGTSRMLDCVDTAISLQPVAEEGLEDENVTAKKFNVVYQKARLFGGKEALPFEASLDHGFWSHRSTEQTDLEKVTEKVNAGMSQREIAKELLTTQSRVFRLITKARKLGLLPK